MKEFKEGDFLVRPIVSVGNNIMGVFTYEVKEGRAVLIDNSGLDEIYDIGSKFDIDEKLLNDCEVQPRPIKV